MVSKSFETSFLTHQQKAQSCTHGHREHLPSLVCQKTSSCGHRELCNWCYSDHVRYHFCYFIMDSKLEWRANVKFCVKLGKSATEKFEMIQQVCGEAAMSWRSSSKVAVLTPLLRSSANRKRCLTCLEKNTSRIHSRIGRNAGSAVLLWNVTILKVIVYIRR